MASCIRGYHVYSENWTAALGEELFCERDIGNVIDRYAVAVKKDSGETVGHLPQKISACFSIEEEKLQLQLQVVEDTHQILYKVGWKFLVILSSMEKRRKFSS